MTRAADPADYAAFVAVAEERSFRRAAARRGVSPSALSHAVTGLEGRLGVKLLNRTTRSVALTDAGRSLYDRVAPALAEIAGAAEAVSAFRERPAGRVRINLAKLAATVALVPAMGAFARRYPEVQLELAVDDDLTDVVAAGFDAGVRTGERLQPDMTAVRITPPLRTVVVGSPGYLAERPAPRTPEDLAGHLCVNYRWARSGALFRWAFERGGRALEVAVAGPLVVDDVDLLPAAALQGVGLVQTLEVQVAEPLAAGRLVRVLDDWCEQTTSFFLYYSGRRHTSAALRALADALRVSSP